MITFPEVINSVKPNHETISKLLRTYNIPAINFGLAITTIILFIFAPIMMFCRKYFGDGNPDIIGILLSAGYIVQCDNLAEHLLVTILKT